MSQHLNSTLGCLNRISSKRTAFALVQMTIAVILWVENVPAWAGVTIFLLIWALYVAVSCDKP